MANFIVEKAAREKPGGHLEAARNMCELYCQKVQNVRAMCRKATIDILDYGTGILGVGRMYMNQAIKGCTDRIHLYDPYVKALQWNQGDFPVIDSEEEIFGGNRREFDLINLSYVINHMEPNKAVETLERLRMCHPEASFVVVDYVLKGHDKVKALDLLQGSVEKKWRKTEGDDNFFEQRSRYDKESLANLVRSAGICVFPDDAQYLDNTKMRVAIDSDSPSNLGIMGGFALVCSQKLSEQNVNATRQD